MATSATSTLELNRDAIIRRAYQLCGLLEASQNPTPDDIDMAAAFLGMSLLDLQADGILPLHVTRATLTLVSGTASYALPSDVFDVHLDANNFVGTIVVTPPVPPYEVETHVYAITRSEYAQISIKTTEATPTRVYIERLAVTSVLFWPTPGADATFHYQAIRFARDVDTGSVTTDMSRRWQLALCYELATHLAFAKSVPLERQTALVKQAEVRKARCRASDVEKVGYQMTVGGYGWYGGGGGPWHR